MGNPRSTSRLLSGQLMLWDLVVLTVPGGAQPCAWLAGRCGHNGIIPCTMQHFMPIRWSLLVCSISCHQNSAPFPSELQVLFSSLIHVKDSKEAKDVTKKPRVSQRCHGAQFDWKVLAEMPCLKKLLAKEQGCQYGMHYVVHCLDAPRIMEGTFGVPLPFVTSCYSW